MSSPFFAEGPNGRLNLNDSYMQFKNWQIQGMIFGPDEPGLNELYGSFEIPNLEIGTLFLIFGQVIIAEFDDDTNYQERIIFYFNFDSSNTIINVGFSGTGELKKFPKSEKE
jgi:hypothetical protein